MDTTSLLALGKIALTFAVMLFAIYRHLSLWLAILMGGVLLALLFGLSPLEIAGVVAGTFPQVSFLSLFFVVACIMLLSEVQGHTGQGRRLVAGLSAYMKSPRLRLAFFPALVGLMPMPGGAIFSCPMVRDVAEDFDISEEQKALINYWFRHIWECAWPLYPGYILACGLAEIPLSLLWRYTFPVIFISTAVGWFFLLRHPIKARPDTETEHPDKRPLGSVLLDALPLVVAIGGAPVYSALFSLMGMPLPDGVSFVLSFFTAAVLAAFQNKLPLSALPRIMMERHVLKMLGLIVVIFIFKDIVLAAQVVDALSSLIVGKSAILFMFLFVPILMGMLTGIMVGFVGAAFPLLLALLVQAGLYEERVVWTILALSAGHFGQMVSPMHSCYLVTVEFFKVPLSSVWRRGFLASCCQLALSVCYAAALYFLIHPLL